MIPFIKVKKEEDIKEVTLTNAVVSMVVPPGAVLPVPLKNTRTATFVVAYDEDVETLLWLCLAFMESVDTDGLSLSDSQLYVEFRKCLRDIVLENYDGLVDAITIRN